MNGICGLRLGAAAPAMPLPTRDYLAMLPLALPTRAVILRRISLLLALALPSAGCRCHMPTIHTEVNAEGHMLNEVPTPGNSGPVHPFNVPAANGDSCGPIVAVIDIDGLLLDMDMTGPGSAGENPVSLFRERLDAAAADPCVRAVVLRINSYGGGVAASDMMRHDLEQFKNRTHLPVVACLLETATGGAYYIATAADQIVALPTTVTGGIGVILNIYSLETFMQTQGIAAAPVKSGEFIDMGTPIHPAPEEQRAVLERHAKEFHQLFRQTVMGSRRGLAPQEEIFDGRIFTGVEAAGLHMVDSLGYPDDAVAAACGMAGLARAQVVLYHRCNDRARSVYSTTPNIPLQGEMTALNVPGLARSRMPTFLYLWQPEPTMEKLAGR